ncbi:MAG: DUF2510 domain-containing protein [Frankiales bacterium]|nr:DUF2510 domain-containing protein [Frankiales bacterium]
MSSAPGWYADPAAEDRVRYWDGTAWSAESHPVPGSVAALVLDPPHEVLPDVVEEPDETPVPWWRRPAVAAGATAVSVVLLVAGGVAWRALSASEPPPQPVATSGPALKAAGAGRQLDGFRPPEDVPEVGVHAAPAPHGTVLTAATLAGWCGAAAATDGTRIARRTWTVTMPAGHPGARVEAVAYADADRARAAFEEFGAHAQACAGRSTVGTRTVRWSPVSFEQLAVGGDGSVAARAVVATDTRTRGTPTRRAYTMTVAAQRGQFLALVTSTQATPFTPGDLERLRLLWVDQTAFLDGTP